MSDAELDRYARRNNLRRAMWNAEGHHERCALARDNPDVWNDSRYDQAERDIDDLITEIRELRRQLEERMSFIDDLITNIRRRQLEERTQNAGA